MCELCRHLVGCDGAAISLFDQSGNTDVVYASDSTALLLSEISATCDPSEWAEMALRNGVASFYFREIVTPTSRAGVLQVYSRQPIVLDAVLGNALDVCADMASEAVADLTPALRGRRSSP